MCFLSRDDLTLFQKVYQNKYDFMVIALQFYILLFSGMYTDFLYYYFLTLY